MVPEDTPTPEGPSASSGAGLGRIARLLAVTLKAARLYPPGHERITASCNALSEACVERMERFGEFALSARPGRIELPDEEAATPGIDLADLSEAMLERGIRAILFRPSLVPASFEPLVSLLRELPLELEGRGGALVATEYLEGIEVIPVRFQTTRTPDEVPPEPAKPEHSPWDIDAFQLRDGPELPENLRAVPGVMAELEQVRSTLAATKAPSEDGRRTIDAIMRIVLDRISRDDPRDEPDPVRPADNGGWDLDHDSRPLPASIPIDEVADRIYGYVLAHLQVTAGPAQAWTPGEAEPGLRPVDPRRVSRTCRALKALPPVPDLARGERLDEDFGTHSVQMSVNLLPLCGEDGSWEASLGRLTSALKRAATEEDRTQGLELVADLLLATELESQRVGAIMAELQRTGNDDGELPAALLGRLAHHPGHKVRRLAERLDDATILRFVQSHLEGTGVSREAVFALVKASGDRVLPLLEEGADDADSAYRQRVAETTRAIDGPQALDLLTYLAADEEERVSLVALRALSERTDEESGLAFEQAFYDAKPWLWRTVLEMRGGTKDLRLPRLLEAIVRGEDARQRPLRDRLHALRTLGRIPGASGRHRVVGLASTFSFREPIKSFILRREARRLLRLFPGRPGRFT